MHPKIPIWINIDYKLKEVPKIQNRVGKHLIVILMTKLESMREQMQKFNDEQLNDLSGGFVSSSLSDFELASAANVNVDVSGHTCACSCDGKTVVLRNTI